MTTRAKLRQTCAYCGGFDGLRQVDDNLYEILLEWRPRLGRNTLFCLRCRDRAQAKYERRQRKAEIQRRKAQRDDDESTLNTFRGNSTDGNTSSGRRSNVPATTSGPSRNMAKRSKGPPGRQNPDRSSTSRPALSPLSPRNLRTNTSHQHASPNMHSPPTPIVSPRRNTPTTSRDSSLHQSIVSNRDVILEPLSTVAPMPPNRPIRQGMPRTHEELAERAQRAKAANRAERSEAHMHYARLVGG